MLNGSVDVQLVTKRHAQFTDRDVQLHDEILIVHSQFALLAHEHRAILLEARLVLLLHADHLSIGHQHRNPFTRRRATGHLVVLQGALG
mgnify:CR=1 FL=1